MGLDAEHHRVYSGCHNKVMTILDTDIGKVVAAVPIGEGVDGNGFDPKTGWRSVPMAMVLLPWCGISGQVRGCRDRYYATWISHNGD